MQNSIDEYTIVSGNLAQVIQRVSEEIRRGWQPYGTPFVVGDLIHQALIRFAGSLEGLPSGTALQALDAGPGKS